MRVSRPSSPRLPLQTLPIRRALLLLGLAWASSAAWAQAPSYPQRPIKIIVGYPAGGASDVAARIVGHKLAERLGQPVVEENRPGSAGNLGADAVAKSAPDGHTLLLGTISLSVNPSLYPKMSYDPLKDLRAVGMISSTPFLLVVHPQSPYNTVTDLLDAARKSRKPEAINYATAGNGSGSHLFTELLASSANIHLTHIPLQRCCAGDERRAGQPGASDLRQHHHDAAAGQGRQAAGIGCEHAQALARGARHSQPA